MSNPSTNVVAGQGGTAIVNSRNLAVEMWTLEKRCDLTPVPHSKDGGRRVRKATKLDDRATIEVVWELDEIPEAFGIGPGTELSCELHLGDSGKGYVSDEFLIESLTPVVGNDTEVIKYSIVGYANDGFAYGTITPDNPTED